MKNILNSLLLLGAGVFFFSSCEEEYEVPGIEPSHSYVKTSFGNVANRLQVNSEMSFIDFSRGVESRTWTFPGNTFDDDTLAIETSDEETVKVSFSEPGEKIVKISQVFNSNVYWNEVLQETNTCETEVLVTVVDSVRATCTAKRVVEATDLVMTDGSLNQMIAGRELEMTFSGTGEPDNIYWSFIRKDAFTVTFESAETTVGKLGSLGVYDLQLIAASGFGRDTMYVTDFIEILPSSDPVILEEITRNEDAISQIAMRFSRDMDDPSDCPKDAFSLSLTNNGLDIPVEISALSLDPNDQSIVLLTLSDNLYNQDYIELAYDASIGNLKSADQKDVDDLALQEVIIAKENLLSTAGTFDNGFENTSATNYAYASWGAPWDKYDQQGIHTNAFGHDSSSSLSIDINPLGGSITVMKDNSGENSTVTVEAGQTYEVGVWMYVEQLGNASAPGSDGLSPDLRFFETHVESGATNWSTTMVFPFAEDFTTGEWVYVKASWSPEKAGEYSFVLRGYNVSSSVAHKVYMDDMIIYVPEERP